MKTILQRCFKFREMEEGHPGNRQRHFFIRAGIVLLTYALLDRVLLAMTNLPLERYHESVIFVAFLKYFFTGKYVVLSLPLLILLICFRKTIASPWATFSSGKSIRVVAVLAAALLAWVLSTFGFNLYFNQGYYADRLLLLALAPLIFWRPVFVFPFLLVLLPFIGQTKALTGFSWAAPYLPVRVLILFSTFYLLFLLTKKFHVKDFVLFLGSILAAHYWFSGSGKLSWDWILHDQIFLLLPATHANGWLPFVEPDAIGSITQTLLLFNVPLKILVLVLEIGGCLFFLHRHTVRFFLLGWMVMHLGIFLVSGICFWMWAALEAGLLFLFFKKNGLAGLPVFTKKHVLVSFLLVAGGGYWCRPVKLAWHDVPVSYTYRLEATAGDGQTFRLPPGFFGPFDYQFTLSGFSYLSHEATLPIVWGATDAATARQLRKVNSDQDIFDLEKSVGTVNYDENQAVAFDNFIKTYAGNWNRRRSGQTPFSYFKAPRLLWTFPKTVATGMTSNVRKVTVVQVTSFYQNGKYREIRELPVREISIF